MRKLAPARVSCRDDFFDFVIEPKRTLSEVRLGSMVESGIHLITNGTLYRKINMERKNGFTERQRWSQIKCAIKTTFAHLCTPLTRDKWLPLPAVSGESSGDKGRFVTPLTLTFDAPQRYIWLASSNMSEIRAKGVAKSTLRVNSAFASRFERMRRYCLAWLISAWYTG